MRTTGAIGFEGLRELNVAGALAALATIMTERLRAYEQASHAVVATEAELFRGAVLDALAHEFKTPLATILTAAGGIREAGPLRPEQLELAHAVESEVSRLEQLTTRLLRLARLDREEVKPQMELIVLVVDDEPVLRKVLQTSLTARGFSVEEAGSGEQAIDIMTQRGFDLVLLDINMPGMGGIGACRRIRTLMPHIGIVMATVRDAEHDMVYRHNGDRMLLVNPRPGPCCSGLPCTSHGTWDYLRA
jgi:CheY-like chemotaxis protein